jgi:hypothetical protein
LKKIISCHKEQVEMKLQRRSSYAYLARIWERTQGFVSHHGPNLLKGLGLTCFVLAAGYLGFRQGRSSQANSVNEDARVLLSVRDSLPSDDDPIECPAYDLFQEARVLLGPAMRAVDLTTSELRVAMAHVNSTLVPVEGAYARSIVPTGPLEDFSLRLPNITQDVGSLLSLGYTQPLAERMANFSTTLYVDQGFPKIDEVAQSYNTILTQLIEDCFAVGEVAEEFCVRLEDNQATGVFQPFEVLKEEILARLASNHDLTSEFMQDVDAQVLQPALAEIQANTQGELVGIMQGIAQLYGEQGAELGVLGANIRAGLTSVSDQETLLDDMATALVAAESSVGSRLDDKCAAEEEVEAIYFERQTANQVVIDAFEANRQQQAIKKYLGFIFSGGVTLGAFVFAIVGINKLMKEASEIIALPRKMDEKKRHDDLAYRTTEEMLVVASRVARAAEDLLEMPAAGQRQLARDSKEVARKRCGVAGRVVRVANRGVK